MSKEIILTQGFVAIVDDADYDWLNNYKWCYTHGYAMRKEGKRTVYMHKLLCSNPLVDHINQNKLDNQRHNLRASTKSLNALNNKAKGVTLITGGKWRAQLCVQGVYHSKVFTNLNDALLWRKTLKESLVHG